MYEVNLRDFGHQHLIKTSEMIIALGFIFYTIKSMARVFISYKRVDKAKVFKLKDMIHGAIA